MHGVDVVSDDSSFGDEDGRETIFASAHREYCVFGCFAFVAGDDRVKAQGYDFMSVRLINHKEEGEMDFIHSFTQH